MPTDAQLSLMYGTDYSSSSFESTVESSHDRSWVIEQLAGREPGVFCDFGCGDGSLLDDVRRMGWSVFGIEWDAVVSTSVQATRHITVITVDELLSGARVPLADAIHFGDVLEHLRQPAYEVALLIPRLAVQHALVLAQGPLDAQPNLFTIAIQAWQACFRFRPVEQPPYHVTLATKQGQAQLLQRLGFNEIRYEISEVDWPAPRTFRVRDLGSPRSAALYGLRSLSKLISRLVPAHLGNRYRYVGEWRPQPNS